MKKLTKGSAKSLTPMMRYRLEWIHGNSHIQNFSPSDPTMHALKRRGLMTFDKKTKDWNLTEEGKAKGLALFQKSQAELDRKYPNRHKNG